MPKAKEKSTKKQLTEKGLAALLEEAQKDEKLAAALKKDFDRALASRGYYLSDNARKRMQEKAKKKAIASFKRRRAES